MSITLHAVAPSLSLNGCPEDVIQAAIESNRQIAEIVWDEPGTPEHCKGTKQWSVRPYRVTDRCDGTRDSNAMLVCYEFCKTTGIDLKEAYEDAYADNDHDSISDDYIKHLEQYRSETEIPEVNDGNIRQLLGSLYDMNWRSLTEVLQVKWEEMGYEVDEFWLDESTAKL